jgi:hypothetical protein
MTKAELRTLYKRQTGQLPNGNMHCLNGGRIDANFDKELSDYIEWLEDIATQTKNPIKHELRRRYTD